MKKSVVIIMKWRISFSLEPHAVQTVTMLKIEKPTQLFDGIHYHIKKYMMIASFGKKNAFYAFEAL